MLQPPTLMTCSQLQGRKQCLGVKKGNEPCEVETGAAALKTIAALSVHHQNYTIHHELAHGVSISTSCLVALVFADLTVNLKLEP